MTRTEIRQAIIILKQDDPQDNFTVLEESKTKIKVKVNWFKGKEEILEIKLKK